MTIFWLMGDDLTIPEMDRLCPAGAVVYSPRRFPSTGFQAQYHVLRCLFVVLSGLIGDFLKSGSNSAVECQLPKLDVAGSIPVSRSNLFNNLQLLL